METVETKKEIDIELYHDFDIEIMLSGSVHDVANNIIDIERRIQTDHADVAQNPDKYIRFYIKFEQDYETCYLKVFGVRMETDQELKNRIARGIKNKKIKEIELQKQDEKDLAEYLRLKNKFKDRKID